MRGFGRIHKARHTNMIRTASEGRSDGDVESEALQLKLLRQQMYWTKIDPLFEDSEDMQSVFTKGHMKSSLDGRPSTFSDSLFGTVCFYLFVDCSCQIWLLHALLRSLNKASSPASDMDTHSGAVASETEAWWRSYCICTCIVFITTLPE